MLRDAERKEDSVVRRVEVFCIKMEMNGNKRTSSTDRQAGEEEDGTQCSKLFIQSSFLFYSSLMQLFQSRHHHHQYTIVGLSVVSFHSKDVHMDININKDGCERVCVLKLNIGVRFICTAE